MTWESSITNKLAERFDNRVFRTNDVMNLRELTAKYSKGTLYRVLHDLVKVGKIERLGRGTYRLRANESKALTDRLTISDRIIIKLIPGSSMKAKELLEGKGIEFMITGGAVFYRYIHNLPKRLINLIYVIKGSGEFAVFTLREAGLRALLNPTKNEVSFALENFSETDIFIIREFSELIGNANGFASLERALVDLYFETTRGKIPFSKEEVGRIFLNVLREEPISHSRLVEYANRRGVGREMTEVLDFTDPSISSRENIKDKRALEFLDTLKKLAWR